MAIKPEVSREFVKELLKEGYIIIKLESVVSEKGESITWRFPTTKDRYLIYTTADYAMWKVAKHLKKHLPTVRWVSFWAVKPNDIVERKIKTRFGDVHIKTFNVKELRLSDKELRQFLSILPEGIV